MKPFRSKGASALLAILVSATVLWVAVSNLSSAKFLHTLSTLKVKWFLLALVANGLLFIPAGIRWHMVLKLSGLATRLAVTLRIALIGHFFYVGLFGALGGDSVRSYYYSRWFKRSLPCVLATAPLDRILGLAGLLLFAAAGALVAILAGGPGRIDLSPSNHPILWSGTVLLVIVLWLAARKLALAGFAAQFITSLKSTATELLRRPAWSAGGVGCGVLVQCALAAVLASNLQAATNTPLPWAQLVWTFPLISVLGGLPISVAGLGTREAAAIGLLGLYGVNGETALVASLLSLASSVFWALCGGLLFWREQISQSQKSSREAGPGSANCAESSSQSSSA